MVNFFRARIRLARHGFSDGWLVLTVALAALAYLVASFCLIALTWDGGGYVFNTIQRGHPAIPNNRFSDYPFLAPVSLLRCLIPDARLLACIYGLVLAVLPLGSVLLSFHFLRSPQYKTLRIWPVLGIFLSVLPGQAFLVAEAIPVTQVSWAVWAIVAAEISVINLVWLGVLSLFLFFLHPSAALVYAVTGGLFLLKARVVTGQRRTQLRQGDGPREAQSYVGQANAWLGIIFLGLAAVRFWYALATISSYERGEESFAENYLAFRDALPSLRMLPIVYLLGLAILGGMTRRIPKQSIIWLGGPTLALLLVYGVAWGAHPEVWASAFSFRRFVLVGTLPLVIMGGLHWGYEHRSTTHDQLAGSDQSLGRMMVGSTAVFLMVFASQALTWREELSHFEADLRRCRKPVATVNDLPWIDGTPLHHWASTQLSCVVQGRKVKTVFALDADGVHGDKILLFPGTWFRLRDRWFEFDR